MYLIKRVKSNVLMCKQCFNVVMLSQAFKSIIL